MRSLLPLLFTSLFFIHSHAQSFKIINGQTNLPVSANALFYCASAAGAETDQYYFIKNTAGSTQTFSVRKYEDQLNTVAPGDAAQAFFCTGADCYLPGISTASFVLAANDSMELKAALQEASVAGASTLRYKISNAAASESLEWTMKYTQFVSVKNNAAFPAKISEVYPNPASSGAFISIRAQQPVGSITLNTFNCSGQLLRSENFDLGAGNHQIPVATENLPAGIYFISLRSENLSLTKKFIVSN